MLQQKQFCCRKSGKQLEEEEEENDVLLTDSMYSVLNVICPISGKPVVNLEYPVRRLGVFTHKVPSNLCAHFIFGVPPFICIYSNQFKKQRNCMSQVVSIKKGSTRRKKSFSRTEKYFTSTLEA